MSYVYLNGYVALTNTKPFTRKSHEEALDLVRVGASYKDVAAKFGVKPDTIYRLAKRRNVAQPRSKVNHPVVTFRLPEKELRAFDALVSKHGFTSRSQLARALARGASGFLEVTQNDTADLHSVRMELHAMAKNLNQLTRAANSGRVNLVNAQWEDLRDLKASVGQLKGYLADLVSEARRRSVRLWRKSEYGP